MGGLDRALKRGMAFMSVFPIRSGEGTLDSGCPRKADLSVLGVDTGLTPAVQLALNVPRTVRSIVLWDLCV